MCGGDILSEGEVSAVCPFPPAIEAIAPANRRAQLTGASRFTPARPTVARGRRGRGGAATLGTHLSSGRRENKSEVPPVCFTVALLCGWGVGASVRAKRSRRGIVCLCFSLSCARDLLGGREEQSSARRVRSAAPTPPPTPTNDANAHKRESSLSSSPCGLPTLSSQAPTTTIRALSYGLRGRLKRERLARRHGQRRRGRRRDRHLSARVPLSLTHTRTRRQSRHHGLVLVRRLR